jgi:hypothetical protein
MSRNDSCLHHTCCRVGQSILVLRPCRRLAYWELSGVLGSILFANPLSASPGIVLRAQLLSPSVHQHTEAGQRRARMDGINADCGVSPALHYRHHLDDGPDCALRAVSFEPTMIFHPLDSSPRRLRSVVFCSCVAKSLFLPVAVACCTSVISSVNDRSSSWSFSAAVFQ